MRIPDLLPGGASRIRWLYSALLLASGCVGWGASDSAAPLAAELREISPGIFQIGRIHLDQKQHTASFPGKLNMAAGALEYLLVTPQGAAHESLLSTEIQPSDLHFAMLLLGAKGAALMAPAPADAPPPQINREFLQHAPKLTGDSITIRVKWQAGKAEKVVPVEDWMINPETHKVVPRGPWVYSGSMFIEGRFLAQTEGAFASLVTYPPALINNPRKGNDNDLVWAVNEKAVPPVDTPVEIIITLNSPPSPPPAP